MEREVQRIPTAHQGDYDFVLAFKTEHNRSLFESLSTMHFWNVEALLESQYLPRFSFVNIQL